MENNSEVSPPKWAQRLLYWYCRPELAEDLDGDLNEYFQRNIKSRGVLRAKVIYALDVIKFCRPYTVRKPDFLTLLIQWIMIGNYLKISGRVILRNRLFSLINVVGLGISMAVGLILIAMLNDLGKYDKFHQNYDRIYRVTSKFKFAENEDPSIFASTSLRTGKAIEESIQGIEDVAVMYREFNGDIQYGEKKIPLGGLWANEAVFKVFTFPLIQGDPSTALKEPYSVVLTETAARKLFGADNALGKIITYPGRKGNLEFSVTGVIKEVPSFSHFKFDMLASLSTRAILEKDNRHEMAWSNMWNAYVYLLLPEHTDLKSLQEHLDVLARREDKSEEKVTIKLGLQPLSDIAYGADLNNSIGRVMDSSIVWMIGVLSFIVVLSACFNYTNLSIARSLRRSREVGIRKVVGALRSQVVVQFVTEAIVISLIALVFSFCLFILLKPYVLSLSDHYREMLTLDISPVVIFYFILLAIGVGVVAGLLPAVFFARVNAIQVLKNISTVRVFRNITLRKVLIFAQFTVSLMFIAATIIGYKHYKNLLAFDLGFKTENVLNINLFGNKAELLKKELTNVAEIKEMSTSSIITSIGNYWGTTMKFVDPQDSANVCYNFVDENYIPLHGHKLLAGKNFTPRTENAAESEVIVNEKVLKRFGIANQNPASAIGETVKIDGKPVEIIGVMRDYQYGKSMDTEIKEFVFRYAPDKTQYVNAKVFSSDWPSTLARIEAAWKKIDDVHPLEAALYDDQIAHSYSEFSSRIKVMGILGFLAIAIAAIGLLGMVVFTTETRLKEISIRKVLGATEASLVFLLSKAFIALLAISTLIALPATQFFFARYALDQYADNAPMPWNELALGMTAVLVTAIVMIGTHTLRIARTNPADVLKTE